MCPLFLGKLCPCGQASSAGCKVLRRELVLRRPHEFKVRALKDIRALFPGDLCPFYSGFGNRDTDEISYLSVGLPSARIFIINPQGGPHPLPVQQGAGPASLGRAEGLPDLDRLGQL